MTITSRRTFLKASTLLPLSAALCAPPALAAHEPPARLGGPRLKISLNSFSLNKQLADHAQGREGMSIVQLVEFCARHDFDGIDLTAYYFPGYASRKAPDARFLIEVKKRCFDLGIDINCLGTGNNFTTADKAARAKELAWVKLSIETAATLGASVLRIFADTIRMGGRKWSDMAAGAPRQDVVQWVAEAIRECADHAATYGVVLGVQNHGDLLRTADDMIDLLRRVDSPWCGALVDSGYFQSPEPYADIAKAAPYAVNWQIKENIVDLATNTDTPLDLDRLARIVRASGYRGYLPIETLPPRRGPYDPFQAVPKFLAELRAAIAKTA